MPEYATPRYYALAITINAPTLKAMARAARDQGAAEVHEVVVYVAGDTYPLVGKTFTAAQFLWRLGLGPLPPGGEFNDELE